MDRRAEVLLERFAAAADDIADEIAEASMREIPAFEAMEDARLREEIRALAAQHVRAFTLAARTGMPAELARMPRDNATSRFSGGLSSLNALTWRSPTAQLTRVNAG
jgi:hypothetical protein